MVSPPRSSPAVETVSRKELAERAARVTAMLDRWEAEDVADEPDWSVEDLEPMSLRGGAVDRDKTQP